MGEDKGGKQGRGMRIVERDLLLALAQLNKIEIGLARAALRLRMMVLQRERGAK